MPDHFTEPSGQYARGHVWVGIGLPSAVRTTNSLPLDTVPRGHGTPQLTPVGVAGARSPSQCRAAAGETCGEFWMAMIVGAQVFAGFTASGLTQI